MYDNQYVVTIRWSDTSPLQTKIVYYQELIELIQDGAIVVYMFKL